MRSFMVEGPFITYCKQRHEANPDLSILTLRYLQPPTQFQKTATIKRFVKFSGQDNNNSPIILANIILLFSRNIFHRVHDVGRFFK